MALDISASEPIILPSSILDQIPLGVQPVDLTSLKAVEKDHGPQYYPDKLLPTITLLQGQEPTLGNGQTIYTDGNHRLLVSSSGGGGSGGQPFTLDPTKFFNGANSWIINRGTSGQFDGSPIPCKTIHGIFVACYATQNNTTAAVGRYCEFRCYNSTTELNYISLLTIPISYGFTGYAAPDENNFYSMTFEPGIDVLSSLGGDGHITLWSSQVNVNCDMHVTLICSTS